MKIRKRRRGTAIVETRKGILVVSGRKKIFLLPGGGANKNESRWKAAARELREETRLHTKSSKYLFRHIGKVRKDYRGGYFQDYHTVVLLKTYGRAKPSDEIKYIAYYKPSSKIRLSETTKEIIDKYYEYKKNKYKNYFLGVSLNNS